jgi:hypothetical protein
MRRKHGLNLGIFAELWVESWLALITKRNSKQYGG